MRIKNPAQKAVGRLTHAVVRAAQNPQATWRQVQRGLRAGAGFLRGAGAYPLAWSDPLHPRDSLAAAVADLLLVGFYGSSDRSPAARLLARQLRRHEVGGVFFVAQNIGTRAELNGLLGLFRSAGHTPLIAIDHEGGVVQRLTPTHGISKLAHPLAIAQTLSPDQARAAYARAGQEIAALGFNCNLGPVLDFHDPSNFAIGRLKRSFGTAPETISKYGEAFVAGFSSAGMVCAAKHFPGHGHSAGDSHSGMADISARWTKQELLPFATLLSSAHPPDLVMIGHLSLKSHAGDDRPATISAKIVKGLLRGQLGFQGVIVTDDIDMEALSLTMGREKAFIAALAAGNDLVMVKNLFGHDPLLPRRAVGWVRKAIAKGVLDEAEIHASARRVRKLRQKLERHRAAVG